jgi:transposase
MLYVGLDVHLRSSSWSILNEDGKVIKEETLRGPVDLVVMKLAQLKEPWSVCFEASCGYGVVYDLLARVAQKVVVAHPGKLRLIFKSKNKYDRADGRKLGLLLLLDQVPGVWVPPLEIRKWRELVEFRRTLVGKRTRSKNQLKMLLRGCGVGKIRMVQTPPAGGGQGATTPDPRKGSALASDHPGLRGKKGMELLAQMVLPTPYDTLRRDMLLEELRQLHRQTLEIEKQLNGMAAAHPGVSLLRTIPGVGPRTAEAVLAYVGDPHRFARNKQIGAYAGLVPCQDSSAGAHRLGHITKEGPGTLRWLLVESAWQAVRLSPTIKEYHQRIHRGHPDHKKIALVATAHHLLRVMLAMLKSGEQWREAQDQRGAEESGKADRTSKGRMARA